MLRLAALLAIMANAATSFTTTPAFFVNQQRTSTTNLAMADILKEAPVSTGLAIRYVSLYLTVRFCGIATHMTHPSLPLLETLQ